MTGFAELCAAKGTAILMISHDRAFLRRLTQRLLWPLTRLADMVDLYQRAMASVDRVFALIDTPVPARGDGTLPARTAASALRPGPGP